MIEYLLDALISYGFLLFLLFVYGLYMALARSNYSQFALISIFCLTYVLKVYVHDYAVTKYPIGNEKHLIDNFFRVVQYLVIFISSYKLTYRDRRAIIPLFVSTVIIVLYALSNIVIFSHMPLDSPDVVTNGSRDVQKLIYAIRYYLGAIAVLSLIDYGDSFYDRLLGTKLFNNFNISPYSFIGHLFYISNSSEDNQANGKKEGFQK